jgi:hypothetical protein
MSPSNIAILSKILTPIFFISNERTSFETPKLKFSNHSDLRMKSYEADTEKDSMNKTFFLSSVKLNSNVQ